MTRKPRTLTSTDPAGDADGEQRQSDDDADSTDERTPTVAAAQVVAAERGSELGVLGVQRPLHLLEQSLLVLGERHGSSLQVGHPGDRCRPLQHKQASVPAKPD